MKEEDLQTLLVQFQGQGIEKVFMSSCCGRVYLGIDPAQKCRTCEKRPVNIETPTQSAVDKP